MSARDQPRPRITPHIIETSTPTATHSILVTQRTSTDRNKPRGGGSNILRNAPGIGGGSVAECVSSEKARYRGEGEKRHRSGESDQSAGPIPRRTRKERRASALRCCRAGPSRRARGDPQCPSHGHKQQFSEGSMEAGSVGHDPAHLERGRQPVARLPVHRDYFRRKRRRSMQCFASATASSFSGAMVERVDRDMMGKSARLAYMPVHQLDHCHMGTISYPRYW